MYQSEGRDQEWKNNDTMLSGIGTTTLWSLSKRQPTTIQKNGGGWWMT
jgi:hypothetical protein